MSSMMYSEWEWGFRPNPFEPVLIMEQKRKRKRVQVKLKIIWLMDWYSYSFLIDSNPLSASKPLVILDVHHTVLQVSVSLGQINLQDYTVS